MIVCPNTSPLVVLARLERLDLLGDPASVTITRAVLDEVHDKADDASRRIDVFASSGPSSADPPANDRIDVTRSLGPGETSVLSFALTRGPEALCVLDDAAARAEARRLGLEFTGTLGLLLRARIEGRIDRAAPLIRRAIDAGLYLSDGIVARALAAIGEE